MCDKISPKLSHIMNDAIIDHINQDMNNIELNKSIDLIRDELGEGTSFGSHKAKDSKDSIDRFGDDLIEYILSFLSFSDKVLFESISRQWKRVIYNKQTELHLNRLESEGKDFLNKLLKPVVINDYVTGYAHSAGLKTIKKESLQCVLKKCKFITTINMDCYCDGEDLDIIGKNCSHFKSFECETIGFNESNLLEFGVNYGNRLEKLQLNNSYYESVFIKKFFKFCINLTDVYTEENTAFISEDELFLPKLQVIKSLDVRSENLSQLKILSEKYRKTMENMKIDSYNLSENEPQTCLSYISSFRILKKLELYISSFDSEVQPIDDNIIELAESCTQLKDLDITIGNDILVTDRLIYSFGKFSSLIKLRLYIYDITKKLEGSVECLKSCSNLKHLTISYVQLSDQFFQDIHIFLPNLRVIDINYESQLTDETIISISKLEKLRELYFRKSSSSNKLITDVSVCQLINSCENIEVIQFFSRPNITHQTIDALIGLALKKSRTDINFFCGISNDGDEVELAEIDLNSYADKIPHNLQINITLGHFEPQ